MWCRSAVRGLVMLFHRRTTDYSINAVIRVNGRDYLPVHFPELIKIWVVAVKGSQAVNYENTGTIEFCWLKTKISRRTAKWYQLSE